MSSSKVLPVSVRQMRGRAASSARTASITASAVAASTTGTALSTMHGSCRPFISSRTCFIVLRSTEFCPTNTVGVGRIATENTTGIP